MSEQTSQKTGVKSSAQKGSNTRYGTQPMPATHKEPGAFGKEADDNSSDNNHPVTRNVDKGKISSSADEEIA